MRRQPSAGLLQRRIQPRTGVRRSPEIDVHSLTEGLRADLSQYRSDFDRIFSAKLSRPRDCRKYLFQLLITSSRLYLDYLLIVKQAPRLEKGLPRSSDAGHHTSASDLNVAGEGALRQRFRERIERLGCWSAFRPKNSFSEDTRLLSLADYIDSFAHHLPEIYGETLKAEKFAASFRRYPNTNDLARLIVSLQHLSRNHISFVHFALEWAADEISWSE